MREIIRSIRRTVHTLKGDSAACGFQELSELAHMLEDALGGGGSDRRRKCRWRNWVSPPQTLLAPCWSPTGSRRALPDTWPLRQMVQQLALGAEKADGRVAKKSRAAKKSSVSGQQVVWTEYEKLAALAPERKAKKTFHIVAQIDPLCAMPIAARQLVANALRSVARNIGRASGTGIDRQVTEA